MLYLLVSDKTYMTFQHTYLQGICAHVDLIRFEDGIAIVSLESSCVMHFTKVGQAYYGAANRGKLDPPMTKIPVYLTPGSLVLISGEARYGWKHEINRKPGFQIWEGQELNQRRRISVTLRKLCRVDQHINHHILSRWIHLFYCSLLSPRSLILGLLLHMWWGDSRIMID